MAIIGGGVSMTYAVAAKTGMNSLKLVKPAPAAPTATSRRLEREIRTRAAEAASLARQQAILEKQAAELSGKKNYNVQDIQSLRGINVSPDQNSNVLLKAAGFGAGFTAFKSLASQLEQAAASQGLNVVYNAKTLGKVSGWGGTAENAWNLARGATDEITAALLDNTELANAQMRAQLVDAAGRPPLTDAYNFTLSEASRFGGLKDILKGLGQASNAMTGFSLFPNVLFTNFKDFMNEWLPPAFQSGGSGSVNNQG